MRFKGDTREIVLGEAEARADWLEDILAGLLSNGIPKNEIKILECPNLKTVVTVRGEPRYEYKTIFRVRR